MAILLSNTELTAGLLSTEILRGGIYAQEIGAERRLPERFRQGFDCPAGQKEVLTVPPLPGAPLRCVKADHPRLLQAVATLKKDKEVEVSWPSVIEALGLEDACAKAGVAILTVTPEKLSANWLRQLWYHANRAAEDKPVASILLGQLRSVDSSEEDAPKLPPQLAVVAPEGGAERPFGAGWLANYLEGHPQGVTYESLMAGFATAPRARNPLQVIDSDDEEEEMNPPFVPISARSSSPFQRGGGTTLFEPNKVKVQGRTSPRRVRGDGGGVTRAGPPKGEMISEELKAFYSSLSVPTEIQDLLVGHSLLYMEDIKLLNPSDLIKMGVKEPDASKITHCSRWHRPSSAAARQMQRAQKKTVRQDQDIYAERRVPAQDSADKTVHIKTFALYQSAGWGSRPSSAFGKRNVFETPMRPQSAPAGRSMIADLRSKIGPKKKNVIKTSPFAWQQRARSAVSRNQSAPPGGRMRPQTSGPSGRGGSRGGSLMSAVMEEAAGDLGGDDTGEEVEMIAEEDMDHDEMVIDGAEAKAGDAPTANVEEADREIYRGVPYGDKDKERPGEGDGSGTVAENLINELRKMA